MKCCTSCNLSLSQGLTDTGACALVRVEWVGVGLGGWLVSKPIDPPVSTAPAPGSSGCECNHMSPSVCMLRIHIPFLTLIVCLTPILSFSPLNFSKVKLTPQQEKNTFTLMSYNVYGLIDFKDPSYLRKRRKEHQEETL